MLESTPRDLAYTPPEVGTYTLAEIDRRRSDAGSGVALGIATVDKRLKPLRPGELVTIIARPSHYKSGLAQWWARWLAEDCLARQTDSVVVYGTCEMAIEELGLYDLSVAAGLDAGRVADGEVNDAEWERLQAAAMKRSGLPLWLLGHSLARRRKRVRMSVFTIEQALFWIEDNMDFRARIVFLDYLNLMETERRMGGGRSSDRRVDVTEIVQCAKDLALTMGCPVVLIAQAHRRVDDRSWKLPEMQDAMEASAIEQFSDKMISLWKPSVTEPRGAMIEAPDGRQLEVTDNLLLFGLIKQKTGPAGGYHALYVDPARNFLGPLAAEDPPRF